MGVMVVLVAMAMGLMVMLVAVLVFVLAMVMMVVLVLVRVLGSCFVAVEPGHIAIVVLELLCKLDVEIAGAMPCLFARVTAIEKPSTGSVASCSRRCPSLAPGRAGPRRSYRR